MPEHVDKLNSLIRIKLQHPFPAAISRAGHAEIQVPLVFKSAVDFFIIDYFLSCLVRKIFCVLSRL